MSILRAVLGELRKMFLGDAGLAGAVLGLVALVAGLFCGLRAHALLAGSVLLFGCLLILVAATRHAARNEVQR